MKQEPKASPPQSQFDPQHPHIPLSIFLSFPRDQTDYYVGENKSIRRFLFQGTANKTYTSFEKEKLREFQAYLVSHRHKLPAILVNNGFWDEAWKMRWLTSEQFDNKNTVKAMEAYSNYLLTNRFDPTPTAIKYLKQGIFYVSGRDADCRPILIFDIDKMLKVDMTAEDLLESQKFFFEYVMENYLLPGQVETWTAIIDVGYQNLGSLIGPMKSSIGFLSNTFRNRMKIAYVVQIPGTLSFLWRIVKNFLHEETEKKINFLDEREVRPLLQYTNPSQLEVKYGGTQPNMTQFWPPKKVDQLERENLLQFSHPKVKSGLIAAQQYRRRNEKSELRGHKVSEILMAQPKAAEVAVTAVSDKESKIQKIESSPAIYAEWPLEPKPSQPPNELPLVQWSLNLF